MGMMRRRGFLQKHCKLAQGQRDLMPEYDAAFDRAWNLIGTGTILVFTGVWGTGKTQLAADLAARIILSVAANPRSMEDSWPLYSTAGDILRDIRQAFKKESLVSEMEVVRKYFKPAFLVLDEFGRRGDTDFAERTLADIIDKRYGDEKDTILIANVRREELATSLDPAVVSRIHECGDVIECNWPSFREKK